MEETGSQINTMYVIVALLGLIFIALLAYSFRKKSISKAKSKARSLNITPSATTLNQNTSSTTPLPSSDSHKGSRKDSPKDLQQNTQQNTQWWNALANTRERFFKSTELKNVQSIREALEEACLVSDLGVANTEEALSKIDWASLSALDENMRLEKAKIQLVHILDQWLQSKSTDKNPETQICNPKGLKVIWFVGVNGVGKTTSIAKLAQELKNKGFKVMLAAGDTFRAAASEQLEIWANRLDIPCVRGQDGADSSAVLFNAIQSAQAKQIDFLLCDSAGRLHNQNQLMEALAKNKRVMNKALASAPDLTLLVLDANTGQNMISQADHFTSAIGVDGMILTKLDGTARGGAVVAVARRTGLPIFRLGLGETASDFVAFDRENFCSALLGLESNPNTAQQINATSIATTPVH